jgi:trigger factor
LDDEFAKGIDPELKIMDSLRERISADLKSRAEAKAEMELQEQALEAAADMAQVEYPPILIESEIDQLLSQRLRRWQGEGDGLDEYLKSIGKTEEEIREELRPSAAKRTVWSLVLGEIADKEKIKVEESDIDTEIARTVNGVAENSRAELNKLINTPRSRRSIEQTLLTRKTMRRLVEIAKGSNTSGETPEKEKIK